MKPKVLLITLNSCYPLFHGGALAQYYFLDGLKNDVEFVLCTQINTLKDKLELDELQAKQASLKIYCFDNTAPKIEKKSLFDRILKIIKPILKSKTPINPELKKDDFKDDYFSHIDHKYEPGFIELIHSVIKKEEIKQVQFDFYETIDLCFAIPDDVKKIFVNHEVRAKRLSLAASQSDVNNDYKKFLIDKTRFFEQSCIDKMDEVVVFNDDDALAIKSDTARITVSPFAIPDELIFDLQISRAYNRLLFIGSEGHTPNLLGISWFIEEIYLPNINQIEYPLHIIGYWSDDFKQQYQSYDKIIFLGVVDSIKEYFVSSIFVNPILTGAGLRTKVLHAFSNKVPVLSTRFGAEGCYDSDNQTHIGFFDTAEEFIKLVKERDFYSMSENGHSYYNEKFNKEILLKKRLKVYDV